MNIAQHIEQWRKAGIVLFVKDGKLGARSKPGAMTPDISQHIKANKDAIILFLEQLDTEKLLSFDASDELHAVASFAQQRFWLLHQITGGSPHHNIAFTLPLASDTQLPLVKEAISILVSRHASLRTYFYAEEDTLFQKIDDHCVPGLTIRTVSNDTALFSAVNAHHQTTFDLCQAPLINLALFKSDEGRILLSVVMHHAIGDDWSTAILGKEFLAAYQALENNRPPALPEIKHTYADYARWQHKTFFDNGKPSKRLQEHLNFWRHELADAPRAIRFPVDEQADNYQSYQGERATLTVPDALSLKVRNYAKQNGVSMFELMLASLSALMFKWANTHDVVIGSVEAGREQQEVINMIGCFINFLAIRTQYQNDDTLASLLKNVQTTFSKIRKHQTCPFDFIVNEINPVRGGKSPLYNVSLRYQNIQLLDTSSINSDTALDDLLPDAVNAQLDLMFSFIDIGESTALCLDYNTAMFEPTLAKALLEDYWKIILTFVDSDNTTISNLALSNKLLAYSEPSTYLLGNFSVEPMQPSLAFWHDKLDFVHQWKFGPFNQIQQELLNLNSALYSDLTANSAILLNWESWLVGGQPLEFAQTQSRQLLQIITQQAKHLKPCHIVFGPLSSKVAEAYSQQIAELENEFVSQLANIRHISVTPNSTLSALYPVSNAFDEDSFKSANIAYTPEGYAALSTTIIRTLYRPKKEQTKVLVLDCDNTLWQGVVGEIGAEKLAVTEPFKAIQTLALSLKKKGVLLALCSKNEEMDVWNAFDHTPDMLLVKEDITTTRINWASKSENIRAIAAELNLGLDSFVFIDDDPVQCAEVTANCPEVLVLQRPKLDTISTWLAHLWVFDAALSDELASDRTTQYKQNQKRNKYKAAAKTFAEYLASLNTVITFSPIEEGNLPRVSELSLRTNQFNTSLRRYDEATLAKRFNSNQLKGFVVRVSDIFGDLGIVGAVLWEKQDTQFCLDSFLLSCRAMGRGVEHKMMAYFGAIAGHHTCTIPVAVGERNTPARNFLSHIGVYPESTGISGDTLAQIEFDATKASSDASTTAKGTNENQNVKELKLPLSSWSASALHFDIAKIVEASGTRASALGTSKTYVAPTTEIQKLLCDEIAALLQIPKVGLKDNFFSLGGNSIQAVQFQSILTKKGISFALPLLFGEHDLASLAVSIKDESNQNTLPSATNNIAYDIGFNDHWLFRRPQRNHWNVSELFVVREDFDPTNAKKAIVAILQHHEGLRRVWRYEDGTWHQHYQSLEDMKDWCLEYDFSHLDCISQTVELEQVCTALQKQLDIEKQLFYVVRFKLGNETPGRIFLVFHHLVVDGYSLGVLKEDLMLAYGQLTARQPVLLPRTQTQLNQFIEHQLARAKASAPEYIENWLSKDWTTCANIDDVSLRNANEHSLVEPELITTQFDDELSDLLEKVIQKNRFDIESLVISALSLAYQTWTKGNKAFLCITRNNRAHEGFNLSRTVGWISRYDFVYLDQPQSHCIESYLSVVSKQISQAEKPSQALQYARFKDPHLAKMIAPIPEHNIEFNYVPKANSVEDAQDTLAPENKGKEEGLHPPTFAPFGKLSSENGKLTLVWGYSPAMYSREDIRLFSSLHIQQIRKLARTLLDGSHK
ncbi:HAD-IIIC family phosphatase [Grimontia marina]|uniref:Linear gramicidin synthase subunit B n=1 Tax=Grimontia marina TaxID=646534 RepID=A0A128EZX3_9GAMM|nr:HAD-IIIC family phosphatase [Grimontia marina]CZF80099.1 Linear gramicidin synthase subunit B [Grimontia marina]